jgi:plastocyanin
MLVVVVLAVVLSTGIVLAADKTVRTTGDEKFVPNAMIQATLRFTPGMIRVSSGDVVTWVHDDQTPAPHTVTIVEELPATIEEVFGCGAPGEPCGDALAGHSVGPTFVLNAGAPGLDAPGDSLLFFDDGSISAPVSAPTGSRLLYLCAIHPWMQGEINVQ